MAATCFEDDFHNRVRKQIQSQFRKSVIPSHLLPYLQCLTIEDEVGHFTDSALVGFVQLLLKHAYVFTAVKTINCDIFLFRLKT